jgi:hypothetical protein
MTRIVCVSLPHGGRLFQTLPDDDSQALRLLANLAPHIPKDGTWEVRDSSVAYRVDDRDES